MRFVILHESSKRIRIRTPYLHMSFRQADLLEYYLKSLVAVKDVSVDERTGNATIYFKSLTVDKAAILKDALSKYDETSNEVADLVPEDTSRELNRIYEERIVFQVLSHYFVKLTMPLPIRAVRTVIKAIPFVIKGIKSIGSGSLKVELLDSIAIGVSLLQGDYQTASSVIFLLNTGETLEEWTRKKSIGDLARAMSLKVDKVWLCNDGEKISVPVRQIICGDHIVIHTSEVIPLDGKVMEGEMTVNQSSMTGEAEPVYKKNGDYVYAGTVVEEGECVIEVTREAGRGKYDKIVKMIEESDKLKSDTETRAYRLADSLVPYSFGGFLATYLLTGNMTRALSFLMVDYSCAMKLSMPLAVLSAIREAREYGISIKGGKFLEVVSEADTVVFDKTGTLTYAEPKLVDVVTFGGNDPDEMLRIAACLEEHYPHSVANAIVNGAFEKKLSHDEMHSKVSFIVAHGVSSYIGEKKVVIGSQHFVFEDEKCRIPEGEAHKLEEINEAYSRIYLAIEGVLAAVLCIFDPPRVEAAEVIQELKKLGVKQICMMTGDNRMAASTIASKLGIDVYKAEVLPEDKASFVKAQKGEGHKVIMIGDGINDSPALSEADVGISVDSGAAITKEIADVTITAADLHELIILRQISMALMHRIRLNYRFIVGFNSGLIALSLAGVITPSSSALLHNSATIMSGIKSTADLLDKNYEK